MSDGFNFIKVHDSVHKIIGLSEIESEIINTRAFQRLRNVRQLSLVHYVFPGADYSRFSHSIGVCHLAGRMFDAIYTKDTDEGKGPRTERIHLSDEDYQLKQKIRLAGLLHDIGHYPFSHTMEDAIKLFF
jgi:HD superfamily phosphohydrolase